MLGGWGSKVAAGGYLYAIIAGATLLFGFYAGIRWEKGAQTVELRQTMMQLEDQANQAIENLDARWKTAATNAQIQVTEWNLQNQVDNQIIAKILAGQDDIRRKFDDINTEITITTDFGTCQLSPDAVRLLRAASSSTRHGNGVPSDRVASGETEATGSDD